MVIKGLDNPFFQTMDNGVKAQASASDVTVNVQAAQSVTDTTGQADKLNAMANQAYGCYVVNPITGTNLIQAVARIAAKNKPIVNIDSPIQAAAAKAAHADIATYIGTDNVAAGRRAGQTMAMLLPSGGQVAAIGGIAGDVTSGDRITGFKRGMGRISLVQTVAANWDRQQALTQAGNVLRAHPQVAGFFVANDDMALGVARAVSDAHKTGRIKIVSVDGIKDALEAVRAGSLSAVVAQYPYVIGKMGVEACVVSAAGKKLPARVDAPVEVITKSNAAKAIATTPKPVGKYDDPFAALLAK